MRLGFVGLGNMGGPMALNLTEAGHELTVHDLRAAAVSPLVEAGAADGASITGVVADGTDAVLLSLPGPPDVEAVFDELLPAMPTGSAIIDLSTSSPTLSRELAEQAARHDIGFLDAPVSGGVVGARRATLAVMVGGRQEVFDRFAPVFDAIGASVTRCGDNGAGNVVKLVNNMMAFINMMGITEALLLGTKAGVDPKVLRDVVAAGSGNSFVWGGGTRAILRDRLRPTFTNTLASKDIGLATELADELGVPVPMGRHTQGLIEGYRDSGFADEDVLATIKALEEQADFVVRGRAPELD